MCFKPPKLSAVCKQFYLTLMILVLTLCLFTFAKSQAEGIPLKALTTKTGQELQVPEELSPDEVDAYLANLTDEQARQVLARKLKQEAAGNLAS